MQRIMIIGGPGAGKTWLAQRLGDRLDLPIIAIDDLLHDEAGRQHNDNAIDEAAQRAAEGDSWIIEGGNTRTYGPRLARAEWLIRLKPAVAIRLWRVLRRGDATPGLLRWTLDYDRVFGPKDEAALAQARGHLRQSDLRSARDATALLQTLSC